MEKTAPLRLLIVEDDPLLRENLRLLLDGEPGVQVLAACHSAEEALPLLEREAPDVMLTDLGLPGIGGVELTRRAKARLPALDILVLTVSEDRESVFAALKAGACGYIVKGATPRELVEGLAELRAGGAPMSPKIARLVIRNFHDADGSDEHLLSPRERGVLAGIAEGRSYKEIAAQLFISPNTVHSHVKRVYEKLHAVDKRDALAKARRKGII
ncbi:MAG: response regulator transcription factor [Rubrivivax sp.]